MILASTPKSGCTRSAWGGEGAASSTTSHMRRVQGSGVEFGRNELELLAAEWSGRRMAHEKGWSHPPSNLYFRLGYLRPDGRTDTYERQVVHLLKPGEQATEDTLTKRCKDSIPEEVWKEKEGEIRDQARKLASKHQEVREAFGGAGVDLWRFFYRELTSARRPIVGNIGPVGDDSQEVWNHAVFLVRMAAMELNPEARYADPRLLEVTLRVYANLDIEPRAPIRIDLAGWRHFQVRRSVGIDKIAAS
jgi:hypothetical protein